LSASDESVVVQADAGHRPNFAQWAGLARRRAEGSRIAVGATRHTHDCAAGAIH